MSRARAFHAKIMFTQITIAALAVVGAAVLWRNWLNDHPSWKKWFMGLPFRIGHAFLCGSCFTYWLTLIYLIIFAPFRGLELTNAMSLPPALFFWLTQFVFWMVLSWLGLILRFSYVMIQELVAYSVHHWRQDEHHHH